MPQWLTNQRAGSALKSPLAWLLASMAHLSGFHFQLDLVTVPVGQCTVFAECNLNQHLHCGGSGMARPGR